MKLLIAIAGLGLIPLAAACGGSEGGESEGAPMTVSAEATATVQAESTQVEEPITIGDTITGVPEGYDPAPFSMMLLSCMETEIAVDGPYSDGYYTFTAQPGMKFVILQYRLANNGVRQARTPYINAGEVLTTPDGYFYQVWSPPVGINSEEYDPRPSTQDEIDTLWGDAGAFETLLPEESTVGRVVFEIPADAKPVDAALAYVPAKVTFDDHCR